VTTLPARRLGRTGIEVSQLGLGGYQFTGEFGVARDVARQAIRTALDGGITFFDTAPMYGAGESEELIGGVVGDRSDIHVSDKVGYFDRTVVRHLGDEAYLDESAIRRAAEHSLHVLRRDTFDALLIHEPEWPEWRIDPTTGEAPAVRALEAMRAEGICRGIGVGGQDAALNTRLIGTGRFDVVLSVMHYDLAVFDARDALLPTAERHDVGVILGTPLRQGLLARRHPDPEKAMVADAERPARARRALAKRLLAIYNLADELEMPLPELALRFLLSEPRVATVIPGARSVEDVRANLAAAQKGPLSPDVVARILG